MLKTLISDIFQEQLANREGAALPRFPGSMLSLFALHLKAQTGRKILILSDNEETHRTLAHDIPDVVVMPESAVMPSSFLSPHMRTKSQLFEALHAMATDRTAIVIAHPSALIHHLPTADHIRTLFLQPTIGTEINLSRTGQHLASVGYDTVDVVRTRGQFSRRGDILDVYPINAPAAVRMQADFDVLDSIRQFDTTSQRSGISLDRLWIPPVNLYLDSAANRTRFTEALLSRFDDPGLELSLKEKLALVETGNMEGFDHYFHLSWDGHAGPELFSEHLVLVDEPVAVRRAWDVYLNQLAADHADAFPRGYLSLDPDRDMNPMAALSALLERPDSLHLSIPPHEAGFHRQSPGGSLSGVMDGIRGALEKGRTILGTRGEAEAERLGNLLFENAVPFVRDANRTDAVQILPIPYRSGFSIDNRLTYLSSPELFPSGRRRPRTAPSHGAFFSDFSDIKPGDYVVHVDYGIARYAGLRTMAVAEVAEECLELTFRGSGRVMLPVSKLHLLQKYQNAGGGEVQLSSLRTGTWQKLKKRVRQEVARYAEELLHHYAERKLATGIACPADSMWQADFEGLFPYDETDDQLKAIQEIKEDMESATPMDRLLCGDVGFGKTEVAMRAAFKSVDNGRQVMVLAPTTVLAFQHLQTFTRRFDRFPIRIEMLSRFVEPARQREIVQQFRKGEIDILVGTHRIFSKDIIPKKLGLLIVDEEQKFGVLHKEKLKMLRKNIDVLSLSATPIPRTLNMSVMGLKDISIIESPPRDRLAINTYHIPFDSMTISEAIQFELKRGGQVYVVNNHIQTIDTLADTIRKLSPAHTRIAVAHGRMPEKELETIMLDFFSGNVDILVSTAIIENGMDVPRANTMMINEAHAFGLSQLYQLRGRIGRSDRAAYAYLITPGKHMLTEDARKRIQALEEFSHLGAGFRIAMLDLELRGAGEILGDRQSGHIQSVGFELYLQMLEDAVRQLKSSGVTAEVETVLEMGNTGVIPTDYIDAPSVRLAFYRRLTMAHDPEKLAGVMAEMEDRFGRIPEQTQILIAGHRARLAARRLGLESLALRKNQAVLVPGNAHRINIPNLVATLPELPGATLDPTGQITIPRPAREPVHDFILRIQQYLVRLNPDTTPTAH